MKVGEAVTVPIQARTRWNRTGLILESGAEYHFEASGVWYDWGYRCSADGYSTPSWLHGLFERFRRAPEERWFALIGTVERRRRMRFRIGRHATLRPEHSGELCCFANDLVWMYWNNRGEVTLRVTRTV